MTEKRVLLEKFELFYSCLVFICETNVLNLDNNLLSLLMKILLTIILTLFIAFLDEPSFGQFLLPKILTSNNS
jgi:hypothetical protein